MQTILGANGQISDELAKELHRNYTSVIRLVSRNPKKVNETDALFPADLIDPEETNEAVKGSDIAYLTVGLPMDTARWEVQFPLIMRNAINACKKHDVKLAFFDNTYMYPQNDNALTEETEFKPVGRKGRVRAFIASMLLEEIEKKQIDAVICRAPEFYGPGKTRSFTNSNIFRNILKGNLLKVFLDDSTLRTLIWTPDASKALALVGNSADTFNQTWHLPCDDNRLTYKQFIALTSEIYQKEFTYEVLSRSALREDAVFGKHFTEIEELLPRYEHNSIFDSTKFKTRFPEFGITSYQEGITQIMVEQDPDMG